MRVRVCVCSRSAQQRGRSPLLLLLHNALAITREICKQFLHLWHGNDVCSAAAPASAAAAAAATGSVVDAALETSRILHRSRIAYENHSCSQGFCNYCVHFYVFVCVRVWVRSISSGVLMSECGLCWHPLRECFIIQRIPVHNQSSYKVSLLLTFQLQLPSTHTRTHTHKHTHISIITQNLTYIAYKPQRCA